MTKVEARGRLGLGGKSNDRKLIQQAYSTENARLVAMLKCTPPDTTRAQITQDILLLKEARDTLIQGGVSAPSTKPNASNPAPRRPKKANTRPGAQGSCHPSGPTHRAAGQTRAARTPRSWAQLAGMLAWRIEVNVLFFLRQGWGFVMAWLAARYNRQTCSAFALGLSQIASNQFVASKRKLAVDWSNPTLGYFRKIFRSAGETALGMLNTILRVTDFMLASWIGAPIAAVLICSLLGTLFALLNDDEFSVYQAFSFPASAVYLDDVHVGEAPSNQYRVIEAGSHTLRFVLEDGTMLQRLFDFEEQAFYIFQVDFPSETIKGMKTHAQD